MKNIYCLVPAHIEKKLFSYTLRKLLWQEFLLHPSRRSYCLRSSVIFSAEWKAVVGYTQGFVFNATKFLY